MGYGPTAGLSPVVGLLPLASRPARLGPDYKNKCTNCKGVKNNTSFGQITGIQENLGTTCKYFRNYKIVIVSPNSTASFRETCQWLKFPPEWVTGPEQG